ncbi:MAG: prolipoprotein diacylglyceryl transferase [Microgenomates group bacterium]
MLPVLLQIGGINLYTFGFFLGIGFFFTSFLVWRRLKQLGLKEEEVIDGIIFSSFLGIIFSRLIFILEHFSFYKFSFRYWVLIFRYPGFSLLGGLIGIFLGTFLFCRWKKWDFWRVVDEVIFGLFPILIFSHVGAFFDGSGAGKPTTLPWGVFFPESLVRQHPVSLYSALFFLFLWIFFLKIENHWRFWSWYPSQAPGFIFLIFLIFSGIFNLGVAFLKDIEVYSLIGEVLANLLIVIFSGGILWKKRK